MNQKAKVPFTQKYADVRGFPLILGLLNYDYASFSTDFYQLFPVHQHIRTKQVCHGRQIPIGYELLSSELPHSKNSG